MNQQLGSPFASITTGRSASGSLHVIGLGREDGLPYLTFQDSTGGWRDTGRLMQDDDTPWSALAAGTGNSNFLHVIGLGREDGLPYLIWQDDKGGWHDAGRLSKDNYTPWSTLATGNGVSNFLQVIGLGREDGLPYLIWQDDKGDWHNGGRLSKDNNTPWSTLVTGYGISNFLRVIGLGREDGLPYLIYQDGTGDWHEIERLSENNNTPWSTLVAARGVLNDLHLIGLGQNDGLPYLIHQDNRGNWRDSGRLMIDNNTPWSTLVAYNGDENKLYVIGLGREDGLPYLMYQDSQGVWHDGGQLLNEYNTSWSTLVADTGHANFLQVIGLGREDGLAYLIFQDDSEDWHNYGLLPLGRLKLGRPLKFGEVLVFSEENHQGREWLITESVPSLDRYFTAASFRIGPKTGVTFFSDREYNGISQELTAELNSFNGSKLQDQKPKSIKIWSAAGKPFTGYWAIEAAEGRYLSVDDAGVLTSSLQVSEREAFRISDIGEAGLGRRTVAFSIRSVLPDKTAAAQQPQPVTLDDIQNINMIDEQEAGFRKFSLLTPDNQWIGYHPDKVHFMKTENPEDRTIFIQSIKIAEDESQVGELNLGEVALFENPAYQGRAWVFYEDYADFECVVNLNEEVSSIQLGPLTCATIYREAEFRAEDSKAGKQDVISNLPSLTKEQVGEDQISSMRIWRIVPPEGLDLSFTCSLSQDFRRTNGKFEEYSAYRTILRLPPTVESVQVWTTDAADIEVDDKVYHVDEDHCVTLAPNLIFCLVITSDAIMASKGEAPRGSLSAPGLKIRTNTMRPNERVIIYPDREVHERLANLKEDELWNATYTDKDGAQHHVIKDRSPDKQADIANAQSMITRVMSTVKYTTDTQAGMEQKITPEGLQGKAWAMDFFTYRVTANALYMREGPGTKYKVIDHLHKNDTVELIEFNQDKSWIHIRRKEDGKMGWSSSKYLDRVQEISTRGKYRVTAKALHVREGPGVEFEKVRALHVSEKSGAAFEKIVYLEDGEIVDAIATNEKGTWMKILTSKGVIGWSTTRYLALETSSTSEALSLPLETAESLTMVGVSTPLTGISALTPNVLFHEISQDDVQALLEIAEFPEADLAQGFFEDIFNAVKRAVSVVVAEVKNAVTVIIKLVDKAVAWIIDTAEKVIAFLEEVFEKIGAAIQDIVEWLRYVFDWDDILATRDYLRESILNALTYMGQTLVQNAKRPVKKFFDNQKDQFVEQFDRVIDQLGYKIEDEPDKSGKTSGMIVSGILDMVSAAQWILSKALSPLQGITLFELETIGAGGDDQDEDEKLELFWADTLTAILDAGIAIPEGFIDVIGALVKRPDEPLYAVAVLLKELRSLVVGLMDVSENIVLGLLDLVTFLVEKFKKIISADIRIPFLSDLLEWFGLSGSLGFSLLDAATLILAIPITVVSKAILGEAPFQNAPALALSLDGWNITIGVSGYLGGLVDMVLDSVPEKTDKGLGAVGSVLEVISWTCALAGFVLSLVGDSEDSDSSEDIWDTILFWYDPVILCIDLIMFVYGAVKDKKLERAKRGVNWTIFLATGLGILHAIALIANQYDRELEEWMEPVAALPEIGSFLRLFEHPIAISTLVIFDGLAAETALILNLTS